MGRWELGRSLLPQFPKRPLPGSPPPPPPAPCCSPHSQSVCLEHPVSLPSGPSKGRSERAGPELAAPKTKGGSRAREDGGGGHTRVHRDSPPRLRLRGPGAQLRGQLRAQNAGRRPAPRKPLAPQSGPGAASGALGARGEDPRGRGGQVWRRSGWHVPAAPGVPPFPPAPPALSCKSEAQGLRAPPPLPRPQPSL